MNAAMSAAMSEARVLLARVGGERFAFPIGEVLEAAEGPAITPVALAPAGLAGQCVHRGVLVPVLDAAALFGVRRGDGAGVILLVAGDAGPMALWVDDVIDMRTVRESQWRPLPVSAGAASGLLEGVLDLDGTLAAVVEMEALRGAMLARLTTEVR